MSKALAEYLEYILYDVLGHIENITSKRMFSGYGLYLDGMIFAIITGEGSLYFKVDEGNRPQFEALGSEPFTYRGFKNKKQVTMPYWLLPEEIMEDKEHIEEWVRQSAAISKKK